MSGMYTMLPLTQVLREGERRESGERKEKERDRAEFSHKTGAEDRREEA